MTKVQIDLAEASQELAPLHPIERIQWAGEQFGEGLWAMTSGGKQSAVLLSLINKAGLKTPTALINTGNLHEEAIDYARFVTEGYELPLHIATSRWGELDDEEARRRFNEDPQLYAEVTKLEPARLLIASRGVQAFLSGIRADQTENRAGLDFINLGRDGEYRVHPVFDWSEQQVVEFMHDEALPEHPAGVEIASLGDRITTRPGKDRDESRGDLGPHKECGLHRLPDGRLIPAIA